MWSDDDGGVGAGAREVTDLRELTVVSPHVQAQVPLRQDPCAGLERGVDEPVGGGRERGAGDARVGVPGGLIAHAAQPASGLGPHDVEDVRQPVPQGQVGSGDDGATHVGGRGACAADGLGDSPGEAHLSHRLELLRSVGAVRRPALDIDGGHDGGNGGEVLEVFLGEVGVVRTVPQMVVGVDDGNVREREGLVDKGEPVLTYGGVHVG
nr:hypothetical protein [Streptomyces argyrophyllae]